MLNEHGVLYEFGKDEKFKLLIAFEQMPKFTGMMCRLLDHELKILAPDSRCMETCSIAITRLVNAGLPQDGSDLLQRIMDHTAYHLTMIEVQRLTTGTWGHYCSWLSWHIFARLVGLASSYTYFRMPDCQADAPHGLVVAETSQRFIDHLINDFIFIKGQRKDARFKLDPKSAEPMPAEEVMLSWTSEWDYNEWQQEKLILEDLRYRLTSA